VAITWSDVRSFAAAHLGPLEVAGDRLRGAIDGDPVQVELVSAWDEPWVRVVAPVAFEQHIQRPIDALRWNAELSVGALAVVEGTFVVRATLCLGELDGKGLDRYVRFVAREAARLARLYVSWGSAAKAVDFHVD
jgi:hypothetical protein